MYRFSTRQTSMLQSPSLYGKTYEVVLPTHLLNNILLQPFQYAKTLIQLGYEPLPPKLSHTPLSYIGLSRPIFMYPWIGSYIRYLHKSGIFESGLWTLYTQGLFASLMESVLQQANNRAVSEFICHDDWQSRQPSRPGHLHDGPLPPTALANRPGSADDESDDHINPSVCVDEQMESIPSHLDFVKKLLQFLTFKVYAVVLTHPFYVISVRQMAAAVGQERHYTWFHQAIGSIYRENGIRGFFQGLVPRLLADSILCVGYFVSCRVLRRVFFKQDEPSSTTGFMVLVYRVILRWMLSSWIQPFRTVSTCMAVSGSSLMLAKPFASVGTDWIQCWRQLRDVDNQLYRGDHYIWRRHVQSQHLSAASSPNQQISLVTSAAQ